MAVQTGNSTLESFFDTQFELFENELNGSANSTFHQSRRTAFDSLRKMGFPGRKNEEYKYTNLVKPLETLVQSEFRVAGSIDPKVIENSILSELDANIVVFVNNVFSPDFSKIVSPESDLIIKPLSSAIEETPDLATIFESNHTTDPFTNLNNSFASEGCFIEVPKHKVIEKPVIIYHIFGNDTEGLFAQPHNLFLIGENSEVSIVESLKCPLQPASYTNSVSKIILKEKARLKHAKLEIDLKNDIHIGNTLVQQAKSSVYSNTTITFGGQLIRNNLEISINGSGSEANMYGLFVVSGKQHVDNHTTVDHKVENAESNELYKGIMDDHSKGVFNGKIYVRQDAQKTNAFQQNNNILLSDDANIYTKPQLEIWADDVKCSHGATTGKLDENQLFYLNSRGIDQKSAKAMLLQAFASEVIGKIGIPQLEEFLEHRLKERLNKYF
jgi:Fe-S cluster assembly protein SufD